MIIYINIFVQELSLSDGGFWDRKNAFSYTIKLAPCERAFLIHHMPGSDSR